jgi:hypothetical protein
VRCRQLLAMPQPEATVETAVGDYRDQFRQLTGACLTECPAGHMVIIEVLKPAKPISPVCDTS